MNNWNTATIGDLTVEMLGGGTPSTKNNSYWQGNIPWITSKWLNSDMYLFSGQKLISENALRESATHLIPQDNIIFATRVGVGKAAINKIDLAINQDLAGIIVHKSRVMPEFLVYQVKTSLIQNEIESYKRGATIKGITRDNLKSLKVSLPALSTQKKIVSILLLIQNAIQKQDNIIGVTTNLKQSLMQKLFTEGLYGNPQKDTEIGLIPEDWQVSELRDVVSYIDYGLSEAIPKNPPKDGVKIVSTADITKSAEILYGKIRTISANEATIRRLKLQDGDVLFNWRNSLDHIGKSAIFREQDTTHIFASFILRIKCDEVKSHNRYLCNLMNYLRVTGVFAKLARRAVNQANYNRNEIYVLKIPIPTYQEQKEIADVIDQIDKKIQAHKTLKESYTMLFSSLLDQLMSGELNIEQVDL